MELKPTADGKLELCSPGLPVSNWKTLEPGGEYHYDPVKGVVRGSGSVDNGEPTNPGGSSFNFGNANNFAFSSDWITADDLGIFNIINPLDMNIGHVNDYLQAIDLTKLHLKNAYGLSRDADNDNITINSAEIGRIDLEQSGGSYVTNFKNAQDISVADNWTFSIKKTELLEMTHDDGTVVKTIMVLN